MRATAILAAALVVAAEAAPIVRHVVVVSTDDPLGAFRRNATLAALARARARVTVVAAAAAAGATLRDAGDGVVEATSGDVAARALDWRARRGARTKP